MFGDWIVAQHQALSRCRRGGRARRSRPRQSRRAQPPSAGRPGIAGRYQSSSSSTSIIIASRSNGGMSWIDAGRGFEPRRPVPRVHVRQQLGRGLVAFRDRLAVGVEESFRSRDSRSAGSPGRDPAHISPAPRSRASRSSAVDRHERRDRSRRMGDLGIGLAVRAPAARAPAAASSSGSHGSLVGSHRLVGSRRGVAGEIVRDARAQPARAVEKIADRQRARDPLEAPAPAPRSGAGGRRRCGSSMMIGVAGNRSPALPAIRPAPTPSAIASSKPSSSSSAGEPSR